MPRASSQIFTSSSFPRRLTLVVAVPPPTELTFSTGPQLCMSGSCVCCQRCTETHPSRILRLQTPLEEQLESNMKGDFCESTPETRYFFFGPAFVPFFPLLRKKKWRSSSGSDVAALICIHHKLTNRRLVMLKTE